VLPDVITCYPSIWHQFSGSGFCLPIMRFNHHFSLSLFSYQPVLRLKRMPSPTSMYSTFVLTCYSQLSSCGTSQVSQSYFLHFFPCSLTQAQISIWIFCWTYFFHYIVHKSCEDAVFQKICNGLLSTWRKGSALMQFAALLATSSASIQLKELLPVIARQTWLPLGLVLNFMANGVLQWMV
jgi:hypothetical protein